MRIQKYIAETGLCSRRKAEEYIRDGKITVNGKVAVIGQNVEENDIIKYNGKATSDIYAQMTNNFGRPKAVDLIKTKTRIVTAGRLDMYTTGAIILTNDGSLVQELTHPKHDIEKEYYVTVRGKVSDEKLDALKNGVTILVDDKKYDTGKSIIKILRIFF